MTRDRESWGDKPYNKDMDFSLCKQSGPTDRYGTSDEIYNAIRYYDIHLETEPVSNAIVIT